MSVVFMFACFHACFCLHSTRNSDLHACTYAYTHARTHTCALSLSLCHTSVGELFRTHSNWTAPMTASNRDHGEVVGQLLEKSAIVDLRDQNGKTALMAALKDGHANAASHLLKNVHSDPGALTFHGTSCLHLAAGSQGDADSACRMVELILEHESGRDWLVLCDAVVG